MKASVFAVCVGAGGIPKQAVEEAHVGPDGLVGDKHAKPFHGGADRAVCVFALEDYRSLQREEVHVEPPGAFGENLVLEGLDFGELRAGDRLRIGDDVELELFDVRQPCATLRSVDARFPGLMVGRSGFVCRVLQGGTLRAGQTVERL